MIKIKKFGLSVPNRELIGIYRGLSPVIALLITGLAADRTRTISGGLQAAIFIVCSQAQLMAIQRTVPGGFPALPVPCADHPHVDVLQIQTHPHHQ
jgi:hypothetical protein